MSCVKESNTCNYDRTTRVMLHADKMSSTHDKSDDGYTFKKAAVAADSPESSRIGTMIMRDQGGSAVDGAIAAVLCSGVVNAHSCGIGGGCIITYYKSSTDTIYTINGREKAPSKISTDAFVADKDAKNEGGLSIGTPGEILGLYKLWELGGRLPWKQLFQPTIDMCRNGFRVTKAMADSIYFLFEKEDIHLRKVDENLK